GVLLRCLCHVGVLDDRQAYRGPYPGFEILPNVRIIAPHGLDHEVAPLMRTLDTGWIDGRAVSGGQKAERDAGSDRKFYIESEELPRIYLGCGVAALAAVRLQAHLCRGQGQPTDAELDGTRGAVQGREATLGTATQDVVGVLGADATLPFDAFIGRLLGVALLGGESRRGTHDQHCESHGTAP